MFVSHEPYLSSDVYRPHDRCVCGCSAIITSHEGIDRGYCPKCAKERKEFTEKIVGSIEIPLPFYSADKVLKVVEDIRINYFSQRIYFLIDCYFAMRTDEDETLPYNNDSFLAKVYREKFDLMENFMPSLPKITNYPAFARMNSYRYYYSKLEKMMDHDWDELCKLDAKICNYPYTKVPRGNNIKY